MKTNTAIQFLSIFQSSVFLCVRSFFCKQFSAFKGAAVSICNQKFLSTTSLNSSNCLLVKFNQAIPLTSSFCTEEFENVIKTSSASRKLISINLNSGSNKMRF
jgi:hypothetical protein